MGKGALGALECSIAKDADDAADDDDGGDADDDFRKAVALPATTMYIL